MTISTGWIEGCVGLYSTNGSELGAIVDAADWWITTRTSLPRAEK